MPRKQLVDARYTKFKMGPFLPVNITDDCVFCVGIYSKTNLLYCSKTRSFIETSPRENVLLKKSKWVIFQGRSKTECDAKIFRAKQIVTERTRGNVIRKLEQLVTRRYKSYNRLTITVANVEPLQNLFHNTQTGPWAMECDCGINVTVAARCCIYAFLIFNSLLHDYTNVSWPTPTGH